MNSLIIPVYKNEKNIPSLLSELAKIDKKVDNLEIIFVVDGSPDNSFDLLDRMLPTSGLDAQLLLLSRNFGSFAAIREGLMAAKGEMFAVMAADLQEPPELIVSFFEILRNEPVDIVVAARESRNDPIISKMLSILFWSMYKRFVVSDIPKGGVDIFGCNRLFLSNLLKLDESNSSLVALLFWMGFRRKEVSYTRKERIIGESSWTFMKKYNYFKNSIFSFTDIPIKILTLLGVIGVVSSSLIAMIVIIGKLLGLMTVPGYSATMLVIIFFGAMNLLGLGIVGTYAWRTYENTKRRPSAIIMSEKRFQKLTN